MSQCGSGGGVKSPAGQHGKLCSGGVGGRRGRLARSEYALQAGPHTTQVASPHTRRKSGSNPPPPPPPGPPRVVTWLALAWCPGICARESVRGTATQLSERFVPCSLLPVSSTLPQHVRSARRASHWGIKVVVKAVERQWAVFSAVTAKVAHVCKYRIAKGGPHHPQAGLRRWGGEQWSRRALRCCPLLTVWPAYSWHTHARPCATTASHIERAQGADQLPPAILAASEHMSHARGRAQTARPGGGTAPLAGQAARRPPLARVNPQRSSMQSSEADSAGSRPLTRALPRSLLCISLALHVC